MDDLDEAVVESRRVPHEPEHEHPVECQKSEKCEGTAVQAAGEVLGLVVESEHMRHHSWELVGL